MTPMRAASMAVVWAISSLAAAAPGDGRPMERITLQDGRQLRGIIEAEDDRWLHFRIVHEPPGRPAFLVIQPIERDQVRQVERLAGEARAELQRRTDALVGRASIEAARIEAVVLNEDTTDGRTRRTYVGKWFTLESTADVETTQRLVVRLEQAVAAYRQILPPRGEKKFSVQVLATLDEYQKALAPLGLSVSNPAVYLPQRNLVLAGSELARYQSDRAAIAVQHRALKAELRQLEERLPQRLAEIGKQLQEQNADRKAVRELLGRERRRFEEQIHRKQVEILRGDRENQRAFDRVASQLLARLSHEGFHAYVDTCVVAGRGGSLPPWLNEGLATMFEVGLLEAGAFRIDVPHRGAVKILAGDVAQGRLMPLNELLSLDQAAFLSDRGREAASQRNYAYAWSLAHYLAIEKNLLAGGQLEKAILGGGQAQPDLQADWHGFVRQLVR